MWANKNNSLGFTIVETLIALSVSSVLFLSVVTLISGQLNKSRSKDAAVQIQSSVQQVLNDVSTGYFPETSDNFTCSNDPTPNVTIGAASRGKNTNCLIAGKKITFNDNDYTVDTYVINKDSSMPTSSSQLALVKDGSGASLSETKPYANSSRRLNGPKSFWILYTNYNANAGGISYASGAQGTAVFVENAGVLDKPNDSNNKVCIDTGKYKNSLTFPTDGSRTVTLQVDDGTNCP